MRRITQAQLRKIHVTASGLGMDDDLLHEYIFLLTEKESLKELSVMEAVRVIDGLEGKKNYAAGDRISCRQESFLFVLVSKLGWVDEEGNPDKKRLNGFVRKQYGIDDYRWLTRGTAGKVIEALKALSERQKKEA